MAQNTQILHFSIGPVQGFVAQARRTRDLWAGSFLLSWLAGQAMYAVLKKGATIEFPYVGDMGNPEDPLLKAIIGNNMNGHPPYIGSIPNRFKAKVPQGIDMKKVSESVNDKWRELSETVWKRYLENVAWKGSNVREIWERQINNFWEILWVIGPGNARNDGAWLGQRKNWRTHWPPEEGGDHCTMMNDWQELSGYTDVAKQKVFWDVLRNELKKEGRGNLLDLRENERLCAIALVKRLFPTLEKSELKDTIGWVPGGGAREIHRWPSTADMAAVPWLMRLRNEKEEWTKYLNTIKDTIEEDNFRRIASGDSSHFSDLGQGNLDGNFLIHSALQNWRSTPLSEKEPLNGEDPDKEKREKITEALKRLQNNTSSESKPFYAILLMDGDRIGKFLQDHQDSTDDLSRALGAFVDHVGKIVKENNGVIVYAGGDDVLAMLPVNTAIKCAAELREDYRNAFHNTFGKSKKSLAEEATVSCAVVFTHFHYPLRRVIEEAHRQLEIRAKEINGRNSLAVAVLLSGGLNWQWVGKFGKRFGELPKKLCDLKEDMDKYSTSFLYNLYKRYDLVVEGLDINAIVLAEHCKGKQLKNEEDRRKAKEEADFLVEACSTEPETGMLQLDGAFIAHFLSARCGVRKGRSEDSNLSGNESTEGAGDETN